MIARRSLKTDAAVETTESSRNPITSFRWGWYGLALFVPFAGILTGLFLYDQDSQAIRKVGRNCLFISFLVWVVFPFLIMLVMTAFLVLAVANWFADIIPAGGD
jgi:hypothetical protein